MSTSNNRHIPEELNNAINMIGDAWILCIISNLGNSSMRFNEIQRSISGINPTTLADRLKKLEKEQILINCLFCNFLTILTFCTNMKPTGGFYDTDSKRSGCQKQVFRDTEYCCLWENKSDYHPL